jgi:hypothetical protein
MATAVESLISSFPHPTIPPIQGQPTYESITDVTRLLNTNAASIHSELGGGNHGHLILTISAAVYTTLSPTVFIAPANPGPNVIIPAGATAPQISAATRLHKENLRQWREYNNVDAALKQQLIHSVDPIYICTLQHRHTGFANVTTRQLIIHLLNSYGNILPNDIAANDASFRAPYDPSQTIETLYSQIEDAMDYADAGGSAYTASQVVTNAYNLIANTGLFRDACREWRRRPEVDKTWDNYKLHFTEAHQDWRLNQDTAQGAGYHGANSAMDSFVNDTAKAFANLATATSCDRQMLSDLSTTNKDLTQQVSCKDAEIAKLHSRLRELENGNGRDNNSSRRPARAPHDPTKRKYHNDNYCWTHGYDIHPTHSSANCNFQADGHKKEATRTNTMNGSTANKALTA